MHLPAATGYEQMPRRLCASGTWSLRPFFGAANDQATMDSAVKQLGQANDAIDRGTDEIALAADDCGLLVATPEPD